MPFMISPSACPVAKRSAIGSLGIGILAGSHKTNREGALREQLQLFEVFFFFLMGAAATTAGRQAGRLAGE